MWPHTMGSVYSVSHCTVYIPSKVFIHNTLVPHSAEHHVPQELMVNFALRCAYKSAPPQSQISHSLPLVPAAGAFTALSLTGEGGSVA